MSIAATRLAFIPCLFTLCSVCSSPLTFARSPTTKPAALCRWPIIVQLSAYNIHKSIIKVTRLAYKSGLFQFSLLGPICIIYILIYSEIYPRFYIQTPPSSLSNTSQFFENKHKTALYIQILFI